MFWSEVNREVLTASSTGKKRSRRKNENISSGIKAVDLLNGAALGSRALIRLSARAAYFNFAA